MSFRNSNSNRGITLVELVVVMAMSSFLLVTVYIFTSGSISSFMRMQTEGLANSKLAEGTFRLTKVIRGINYIDTADADQLIAYAYFAPNDTYTSKIRYYLSTDKTKLLADVTPMTADYPIGSLITSQKRTVTIVDQFYKVTGQATFKYYDSGFTELTSPVTDKQSIKNIGVHLFVRKYASGSTSYVSNEVSVSLRNRKSNL